MRKSRLAAMVQTGDWLRVEIGRSAYGDRIDIGGRSQDKNHFPMPRVSQAMTRLVKAGKSTKKAWNWE